LAAASLVEGVERLVTVDRGGERDGRNGGRDIEHGKALPLGCFRLPHRCK
jgi:hypothetical protein